MQVNFFATFRLHAGQPQAEIHLPENSTAWDAVLAVLDVFPQLRPHWLNAEGELYSHVHVFLNGEDIATLDTGWSSPVGSSDVLDFIPPVAGGSQQEKR